MKFFAILKLNASSNNPAEEAIVKRNKSIIDKFLKKQSIAIDKSDIVFWIEVRPIAYPRTIDNNTQWCAANDLSITIHPDQIQSIEVEL